jgi:cobyrinic acid a,c-diamide synthase
VEEVTGLPGRHLDHWLMPPEVCREALQRGLRRADLAVVEGTLDLPPVSCERTPYAGPGPLADLIEPLGLPVVAVLPCPDPDTCHLSFRGVQADAILLDGLTDPSRFATIRSFVELATRTPVLGAVEELPALRQRLRDRGDRDSIDLADIERLAASFRRFVDLDCLRALGDRAPAANAAPPGRRGPFHRFRVAFAMDEAFCGYDPDTLENLEALGAELVEFSPLADEALPAGVELVLIGCGYPERYASALAANFSLVASLKQHVCRGLRIVAEGGGAAYLARYMVVGGEVIPGAAILPVDASLRSQARGPVPVQRSLAQSCWLGQRGTLLRGYRTGRWSFRPAPDPGDCPTRSGFLNAQRDLCFRHHAIGSLIHLHLGALPEVVRALAGPHRPSLALPARLGLSGSWPGLPHA